MSTSGHSRTSSGEGSAYPWILDHILSYPGSYEIPLRTMYTLNSTPRAQPLPHQVSRAGTPTSTSSTASSPTSAQFPPEQQAAQAASLQFRTALLSHISQLPCQPCSLPPSFVTSFVRRCFPPELTMVDFPQALTGLDYLKDLETRRRKEVKMALHRLGVENPLSAGDEISQKHPSVAAWVKGMEDKERKIEALYTQLFIGLRRWVLINELSLTPFNKHNCVAMLNTLYPPTNTSRPTPQLTPTVLSAQRNGFFRYIQGVERNGPAILENLIQQGRRQCDENGWAAVRDTVDAYLRTANAVIETCSDVTGVEQFIPESEAQMRQGRKVDSGVSFATDDRPSTSSSGANKDKPLPPSPELPTSGKGGSTMERIARELRRMRVRNKPEDISKKEEKKEEKVKAKSLKKTKSATALRELKNKNLSATAVGATNHYQVPAFDIDEMKRQKMIYDAKRDRLEGNQPVVSFEV
ncbi:MAG: hypothetical protein M1819_006778 [Sarea resinae]|nr:MAG: hypothetical protein M1819_006778 [Sarea resinae]